ncbi:MAG TPA: hypothetical protein VMS21_04505 [Methylomirabilota bacterium]|nr:hypothetical protein [Methylomirabilota bacterium]
MDCLARVRFGQLRRFARLGAKDEVNKPGCTSGFIVPFVPFV